MATVSVSRIVSARQISARRRALEANPRRRWGISRPPGASSAKRPPHRQPVKARRRKLPWRDRGAAAPSRALIQAEQTCFCQRGIGAAWGKAPSPPLALHDRRVTTCSMDAGPRRGALMPRLANMHRGPRLPHGAAAPSEAQTGQRRGAVHCGGVRQSPVNHGQSTPPTSAISGGERAGTTRAQTNQGVPHPRAHP